MSEQTSSIRVMFFGDSICVGQGASIHKGWVAKTAAHFDGVREGLSGGILVMNNSVNGRTTRQALEDMPYHVQGQSPDILIVQYGMNDCNYWLSDHGLPRVSPEAFKENLREIIRRGKHFGARYVLLNNNHPTNLTSEKMVNSDITFEDSNRKYNAVIRDLASELGGDILFQDIEMHFQSLLGEGADLSKFLLDDGMHLGESGHQVYFDLISPVLANAIDSFGS